MFRGFNCDCVLFFCVTMALHAHVFSINTWERWIWPTSWEATMALSSAPTNGGKKLSSFFLKLPL